MDSVNGFKTFGHIENLDNNIKNSQKPNMSELSVEKDNITLCFEGDIMSKIELIARLRDQSKDLFLTEIIKRELKKEKYNRIYSAMKAL